MRTIVNTPGKLYLGKRGEHLARELAFPEPAAWAEEFGPGAAQLLVSPNGGRAYPVVLTEEDGFAVWRVTAADTARAGYGRCELRWSVDGMVVKSKTYVTYVSDGLSGGCGRGGDSWGTYLEQILQAGADALNAASRAESAALHAPTVREGTWWVWLPEDGGYTDTGVPATGDGGIARELGSGLKVEDGKLTVDTTDDFTGDNTLPMTAAGVQTVVGNIDVLLGTI